jgi:hypothetical protein
MSVTSTKSTKATENNKLAVKQQQNSAITKPLTQAELEAKAKRYISCMGIKSKDEIIKSGVEHVDGLENGKGFELKPSDPAYQMMIIYELDHGWLLSHGFTDKLKPLSISLSKELQIEYECKTPSEKATAHLVAQSFVRMLELQRYIKLQLDRESFTDMSTARLITLEKSLEKASRQYQQHLLLLRSMNQPAINVTVKAVTANIANQQIVHEVQNINAK